MTISTRLPPSLGRHLPRATDYGPLLVRCAWRSGVGGCVCSAASRGGREEPAKHASLQSTWESDVTTDPAALTRAPPTQLFKDVACVLRVKVLLMLLLLVVVVAVMYCSFMVLFPLPHSPWMCCFIGEDK
ncbi:hypothetical protein E2C01_051317 [Portunus trituberculatus]|uniref:Uncharacterized protein n=1 Tax=Portunus trituberculatus TaxID=210409 RepID=A0A5B7GIK8_PORTR|nr:hypothetical protein [Portunus trituberculatus]